MVMDEEELKVELLLAFPKDRLVMALIRYELRLRELEAENERLRAELVRRS